MGLFDGRGGLDEAGSTADLARLWDLPGRPRRRREGDGPVGRGGGPGFAAFDPSVRVAGVVANRVGSHRHYAEYLAPGLRSRAAGGRAARLPGARRAAGDPVAAPRACLTADEFAPGSPFFDALADAAEATSTSTGSSPWPGRRGSPSAMPVEAGPAAGAARSGSPWRATRRSASTTRTTSTCSATAGAEVVPFSPLDDPGLPEGRGLVYLGGGYPEVFAARLAANAAMRDAIRRYHAEGGAILAECGGLMACAEVLRDATGGEHPLWGLIPARVVMHDRFAALGYVTVATERATRLGPAGTRGPRARVPLLDARTARPARLRHDAAPPGPTRQARRDRRSAACSPVTPTCTSGRTPASPGACSAEDRQACWKATAVGAGRLRVVGGPGGDGVADRAGAWSRNSLIPRPG